MVNRVDARADTGQKEARPSRVGGDAERGAVRGLRSASSTADPTTDGWNPLDGLRYTEIETVSD
ncbi:MAG TPA: hypothetical protein VIJ63_05595 [Roseiarcus sp.]